MSRNNSSKKPDMLFNLDIFSDRNLKLQNIVMANQIALLNNVIRNMDLLSQFYCPCFPGWPMRMTFAGCCI